MFKSILCPIDFSSHSRDAVRHAVATAHRFGGRVTVMFVEDPLLLAAAGGAPTRRRQFVARTQLELARYVKRAIGRLPPVADGIALVVATGNPAYEILRTARLLRSDLIVMGTQGLSGFRKLFFGSTTEQVLRRAGSPVLAIPPSRDSQGKRSSPMTFGQVIAPLDLAGEWQSDAIRAARVATAFGARLLLVHVLAPVQAPPWLRLRTRTTDRRRSTLARRALERVSTKLSPDVQTTCRVLKGNPADEI